MDGRPYSSDSTNRTQHAAVTFAVSDVVPATDLLPETSYKSAVENLLQSAPSILPPGLSEGGALLSGERHVVQIEACSSYCGNLANKVYFHPFVYAVGAAFNSHRPLVLSPDVIWLLIVQGVANHVNADPEARRSEFVSHEGKATISVRRDDFVKGSPENP